MSQQTIEPTVAETEAKAPAEVNLQGPGSSRDLIRAARPATSARPAYVPFPAWAVGASVLWLTMALTYTLLVGGVEPTPAAIGGLVGGMATPLVVIWLVALWQMRNREVEAITAPVRRQLAALLAPGHAADVRVRRVTQALAEQAEQLKHAANVALEDSGAAMNAIMRQSGELRRISSDALSELHSVGRTAEQTLQHLQQALAQVDKQTGVERERALSMVTELEKHIRDVLSQVDRLSTSYETKLVRLSETSDKIEERTKILSTLTDGMDTKVDSAAHGVLGDLDRLEAAVAELGQRSAAIAHQLSRPVESLEQAARHLDSNMRQSQEMLTNATANLEKIGDNALSRSSALVSTLSDRLSSMELVGAKIVSVGAAAQADTGRYVTQIEAAAERIRSQTEQGQQHLTKALKDFDELAQRTVSHSDDAINKLHEGAGRLSNALVRSEEQFSSMADDIENRVSRLNDLSRDARAEMEEARMVLDAAQDGFATQLERLGGLNDELNTAISRAGDSANRIAEASSTARSRADELLNASETTRSTLGSISGLLTSQQDAVQELAASLTQQVDVLAKRLSDEQQAIRAASASAASDGENTRAVLRELVQGINAATADMAQQLDMLDTRLKDEHATIEQASVALSERLSQLSGEIQQGSAVVNAATSNLGSEQKALSTITEQAEAKLGQLAAQLVSNQRSAVTAMDEVAERLATLSREAALADESLKQQASGLDERHGKMQVSSQQLGESLTATLARMDSLSGGLEGAGKVISAQGQAAAALMEQVQLQLLSASTALRDESQSSEMALANVGAELSVQQAKLSHFQQAMVEAGEKLKVSGDHMEESEARLHDSTRRALENMSSMQDKLVDASATLQTTHAEDMAALEASREAILQTGQGLRTDASETSARLVQLKQDIVALETMLANLNQRSDAVAGSLAQQAANVEMSTGRLQGLSSVADQSSRQMMQRAEELGSLAAAQQQQLASLSLEAEAAHSRLSERGEQSQLALRQTISSLESAQDQTDSFISRLTEGHERLTSLASDVQGEAVRFDQRLETLEHTATKARHEMEQARQATADLAREAGDAGNTLQAAVESLGAASSEQAQRLHQLTDKVSESMADLLTAGMAVEEKQQLLATRFDENKSQMDELGTRLDATDLRLSGVTATLVDIGDKAEVSSQRLGDTAGRLAVQQSEITAAADRAAAQLEQRLQTLTESATANRLELEQGQQLAATATHDVQEAALRLHGAIDALGVTGRERSDELANLTQQVSTSAEDMRTVISLAEEKQARLGATLASGAKAAGQFSIELETARTRLQAMEDGLQQAGESAQAATAKLLADATALDESQNRLAASAASAAERLALGIDMQDAAQRRLAEQETHNEQMLTGLAQLAGTTTTTLETAGQRMAMLAHQAASDGSRLADMALKAEQQQEATRQAAEAAVATMRMVEAQLLKSAGSSQTMLEHTGDRVMTELIAMTARLTALSQQGEGLLGQLRNTTGEFGHAVTEMKSSSATLSSDLESMGGLLHSRALDLTAAAQQLDREIKARIDGLHVTQNGLQDYFSGFSHQLEALDNVTSEYIVEIEQRSNMAFGRLQDGVTQLSALPEQVTRVQQQVLEQVGSAQRELSELRQSLQSISQDVQQQMASSGALAHTLTGNLQDVGIQSRMTAEQLESITHQLVSAANGAWQAINTVVAENTLRMGDMAQTLEATEQRTMHVTSAAREQLEGVMDRLMELGSVAESSLTRLTETYSQFDGAAINLAGTAAEASSQMSSSGEVLTERQARISEATAVLRVQLQQLGEQLGSTLEGLNGLSGQMAEVAPMVGQERQVVEDFSVALQRSLQQVADLQASSRELVAEHLSLAADLQASESSLLGTVSAIEGKVGQMQGHLNEGVLSRLEQAAKHAAVLETHLSQLSSHTGRFDGALSSVRQSLASDVQALESAQNTMEHVATRAAAKVLEVGNALNSSLGQLQKGGQLTQSGLQQTNEETQRLIARLEQVRAHIRNSMGSISTEIEQWQNGLKSRLEAAAASTASLKVLPPLPAALTRPVTTPATPVVGTSSSQLTAEALQALAVDLYRLLHTEVVDFKRDLAPQAARRQPLRPEDARAYTRALLDNKQTELPRQMRELYARNLEFRQYVDRYLARFEAQYDVLARSPQGLAEADKYRSTEVGLLYELLAAALERRRVTQKQVAAS